MPSIGFVSLFFGLITGPYPVTVVVDGPVAAVELQLDHHVVATLREAPWTAEVDFGTALEPHELVARALDRKGAELARAHESVNLSHPSAKAVIHLEPGAAGVPKAARLTWSDVRGEDPASTSMTFDGAPLRVAANGVAPLPPHDLRTVHVLSAELQFSSGPSARRDLVYGGRYGDEVSEELTAVAIRLSGRREPTPATLAGQLTADGQALTAVAVENGPSRLLVVRSPSIAETSERLGRMGAANPRSLTLQKDDEVLFLFPFTSRFASGRELTDLFDVSPHWKAAPGARISLPLLMMSALPEAALPGAPRPGSTRRIADAVAAAGLDALRGSRKRAVLLLLSGREADDSRYDPVAVRRYLAAIQVPLFVWYLEPPLAGSRNAEWGGVDASYAANVRNGVAAIRKELRSQRIVLVGGRHLPQSIRLAPEAKGLAIAGQP